MEIFFAFKFIFIFPSNRSKMQRLVALFYLISDIINSPKQIKKKHKSKKKNIRNYTSLSVSSKLTLSCQQYQPRKMPCINLLLGVKPAWSYSILFHRVITYIPGNQDKSFLQVFRISRRLVSIKKIQYISVASFYMNS